MQAPRKVDLTGLEKTAILMNVLGEQYYFRFLKQMEDGEVRKLLNVMGKMKKAPIALINNVLEEYLFQLSEQEDIIFENDLTNAEFVEKGLGEERARQIFGDVRNPSLVTEKTLNALEDIDVKTLAEFLVNEHPQTIALVLAHMGMEKQMTMIKLFPDSIRAEVVMRMANLDHVSQERLKELNEMLKNELDSEEGDQQSLGGVEATADLINGMDKKLMNSILARLEDKDPLLTEEIRQHMFTFTDLSKIDDRGIQLVLREVANNVLLLSMKSAPDEVKQKIFGCVSERASEILKEDLAALGPQKVSDVEYAQREVVKVVKRLEEEGKIVIGIGEEQEIIP